MDFERFLEEIRSPIPAHRLKLVLSAFEKLDVDGTGLLGPEDIAENFDADGHYDVAQGVTAETVFADFMEHFDVGSEVPGKAGHQSGRACATLWTRCSLPCMDYKGAQRYDIQRLWLCMLTM